MRPMTVVSTGNRTIDSITRIGGYPRGRLSELFGSSSSGKSLLALQGCTGVARRGGIAAWCDFEHTLPAKLPAGIADVDQHVLILTPKTPEEGIAMVVCLLEKVPIDLLVLDSAIVMVPARRDRQLPLNAMRAEFVGSVVRRLVPLAARQDTALVFLSRMYHTGLEGESRSIGGNALRYAASLRIQLTQQGLEMHDDEIAGYRIQAKVVKNKLAVPYASADLWYRVDQEADGC